MDRDLSLYAKVFRRHQVRPERSLAFSWRPAIDAGQGSDCHVHALPGHGSGTVPRRQDSCHAMHNGVKVGSEHLLRAWGEGWYRRHCLSHSYAG